MIGKKLGPYRIEAPLGAGGMGEVYRATDTRLGRAVAVKVLPREMADDAQAVARFEREARAVAALSHPNILALHDFDHADGIAYAVTELLEGETLRARLAAGALPPRKAIDYGVQVARGLAAAHERGVVHRDLKPENLFVTRDEQVKILDFGLAKQALSTKAETLGPDDHTGPGVVLGTVGYMSPEQVRGEEADARSDLFSFGAVLYEMLSGRRAFRGDSAVETMSAILKEEPEELTATGRDLPPGLDRIVRHCLEKAREVRFQSARDLAFDLESVAELRSSGARAPLAEPPASRRRGLRLAAVGVVSLLAALAAGWWLGRGANPPASSIAFQKLTLRRGAISAGRFAPDGQSFVYSAAWDGGPSDLFLGRIGSPDARALGLEGSALLAVSPRGELAISLGWHREIGYEGVGTLATAPLEGGAPRELLDGALSADFSPDGRQLAVSRFVDGACRLEYPIGTVLATSTGWISDVRLSADGSRVAFVDHASRGENLGVVSVVGADGEVRRLSPQQFLYGIDWSPDGREIWAALGGGTIVAYSESGASRRVSSQPGQGRIDDVAPDGRVLLASVSTRREIVVRDRRTGTERNLGWFDWSFLEDLSDDGLTLLFDEQHISSADGYAIYVRGTDGSPAVRLGEGRALSLSNDKQWVLAYHRPFVERPRLALIPTGAGAMRELPDDGIHLQGWGSFVPGGDAVLVSGVREGGNLEVFLRPLDGQAPARQISRRGARLTLFGITVSPRGDRVALPERDGAIRLYPLDGGEPKTVAGARPEDEPVAFSADGRTLFVVDPQTLPLRIDGLDLVTGERRPWTSVALADPAGVARLGPVVLSADGETVAASFIRSLDELYLATGFASR